MNRRLVAALVVTALLPVGSAAASQAAPAEDQASNLQAFFRDGQTFLTWQELPSSGVRYRIYRSTVPFDGDEQLDAQALVATVDDQTSFNLMASVNRLEADSGNYEIPARAHFVITDGGEPLAEDTGLFVHTAKQDGVAYYAVTAVVDGIEQRALDPGENTTTAGIAERVEEVGAVRQNDEADYVHWTDSVGTEHYPVMTRQPSIPYNFRVHAPDGAGPYPLIGVLHGFLFQYDTPDELRYGKLDGEEGDTAIRVSLDSPVASASDIVGVDEINIPGGGWWGWIESGVLNDLIATRVLWTLDWVARTHPVDHDRVSLRGESAGAVGSLALAFHYPERFAAIHAYAPRMTSAGGSLRTLFPFHYINLVQADRTRDLPYVLITAGRLDQVVGWPDKLTFMDVARAAGQAAVLYWDGRGHTYTENPANFPLPPVWGEPGGLPTEWVTNFSRQESFPALADLSLDSDPGTVNLGVPPFLRPALDSPGVGDMIGTINGTVTWDRDTIADSALRWEVTLRLLPLAEAGEATATVTPRRLQVLEPGANETHGWTVTDARTGAVLDQGEVDSDADGLLRVPGVPITSDGIRLHVWRNPDCTDVVAGAHDGALTVTEGVTCIEDATVSGPVSVAPGAGLFVTGSRIEGPVRADGAADVTVCGSTVTGPVTVTAASAVTLGDPVTVCDANEFGGPVRVRDTAGPSVLAGNTVGGPLECSGNEPPPVNRGVANSVSGPATGQCTEL